MPLDASAERTQHPPVPHGTGGVAIHAPTRYNSPMTQSEYPEGTEVYYGSLYCIVDEVLTEAGDLVRLRRPNGQIFLARTYELAPYAGSARSKVPGYAPHTPQQLEADGVARELRRPDFNPDTSEHRGR